MNCSALVLAFNIDCNAEIIFLDATLVEILEMISLYFSACSIITLLPLGILHTTDKCYKDGSASSISSIRFAVFNR